LDFNAIVKEESVKFDSLGGFLTDLFLTLVVSEALAILASGFG
jgi:hypothetical protein